MRRIFNLLEWLGFAICLYGIYLYGYYSTNIGKTLIFTGATITFISFFIKKKEVTNNEKYHH